MHNHFELLSLPDQFALDERLLEKAYFEAQRATHPDRFVGKPETERVAAILQSQAVNEAYEALKSPVTRAEHLLELQGMYSEEGEAPPALLMEMMELREQLEDAAQDGAALIRLRDAMQGTVKNVLQTLAAQFSARDYASARVETMRLRYLMKALEQVVTLLFVKVRS